jgi:16S rRNA (uracil1498-N3)-methyltransferase
VTSLRARADAAAQVLVDDLAHLHVSESDRHHLVRVLRLRAGEVVVACDGRGSWQLCAIDADGTLAPKGDVTVEASPSEPTSVWLPPLKGDRAEWAIAKLTELGIDVIGLLRCERTSVRLDPVTTERILARWRRVAREAACQSRRTWLPTIAGPLDVAAVLASGARTCDLEGTAPLRAPLALVVGPEGGWGESERRDPAECVGLAATVLRTETAAVVAAAALRAPHGLAYEAQ